MAKSFISVNFYGHNEPKVSGIPAEYAPIFKGVIIATAGRMLRRAYSLNVVGQGRLEKLRSPNGTLSIYDYNAALNEQDNKDLAKRLADTILKETNAPRIFLITGYSIGGVSAVHFGRELSNREQTVCYLGLADAAFQRNESEYLMKTPGVTGKYLKNYYQTQQNDATVSEIHDEVIGFKNFNLNDRLTAGQDPHDNAVKLANDLMFNDVKWCIENC